MQPSETNPSLWRRERWSPYAVGAGIGVLSWITFLVMDKALGASTTFVRASGVLEAVAAPEHVHENAYFAKYLVGSPAFDWQFALVVFLAVGAWLAARLARSPRPAAVPALWSERFGPSRLKRGLVAFVGGVVLLYGARMAGGCTSGHGISGGLQLAVSSWVFFPAMFATGVLTSNLLFRRGRATR